MVKPSIDDVLQQGIHGAKETKPEEGRKFLGTLRERILVALTKSQVYEPGIYAQVEDLVDEFPEAHMYLNGNMGYEDFLKYLKKANEREVEYTIVTNKEHDTDIGLVLALDYAIEKEEIYIEKNKVQYDLAQPKKSFFSKLGGWLRK